MLRTLCTMALLTACAPPTAEYTGSNIDAPYQAPAHQQPPPGSGLLVSNMVLGEPLTFRVTGAPPNAAMVLAFSSQGPGAGPCPPSLGGSCLDILAPNILASTTTDGSGEATITRQVPATLALETVTFQAVELTGAFLSEPVTRTVQATLPVPVAPCPVSAPTLTDAFIERGARIEGDTLFMTVEYSGGCMTHEFDMCFGGFMTSLPVQVDTSVTHNANGDMCRALIVEEVGFDLAPLRQAYPWATPADIVVHTDSASLTYSIP